MTSNYLIWKKTTIKDLDPGNVVRKYDQGYVFVRTGKGNMVQTRSLRINLDGFEFNSENRRVLKKNPQLTVDPIKLPVKKENYNWQIHKLGADFYKDKFGEGTFSANKIQALITSSDQTNFTTLLQHKINYETVGYCICYENTEIFHYAYPFYDHKKFPSIGMAMMLKALEYALMRNLKFFYLGSASKPQDRYKLQFNLLEWFDGEKWTSDLEEIKKDIT